MRVLRGDAVGYGAPSSDASPGYDYGGATSDARGCSANLFLYPGMLRRSPGGLAAAGRGEGTGCMRGAYPDAYRRPIAAPRGGVVSVPSVRAKPEAIAEVLDTLLDSIDWAGGDGDGGGCDAGDGGGCTGE